MNLECQAVLEMEPDFWVGKVASDARTMLADPPLESLCNQMPLKPHLLRVVWRSRKGTHQAGKYEFSIELQLAAWL